MTRRLSGLVSLCLLLASFAGAMFAQSTTQAVTGLVTDSSGAIVAGAKVTLTNIDTGVAQTVNTNETGNYTFTLVPV